MATANRMRALNRLPYDFEDGLKIAGVDVTTLNQIGTANGAGLVGFAPVGGLSSSNVQSAIVELDTEKVGKSELADTEGAAMVGYDSINARTVFDNARPIADYTALRAYTGRAAQVRITSTGISGFFYYDSGDTTSLDDGGTIIVASNGRRWKRLYDGAVNVKWFGAVGNGSTDDWNAFYNALAVSNSIYAPAGAYLISKALQLRSGKNLYGDGPEKTSIFRTSTSSETIDSLTVKAVIYLKDRNNSLQKLKIVGETTTLSGIYFNGSNSSLSDIVVQSVYNGIDDGSLMYMVDFSNVIVRFASNIAYKLDGTTFKTSLTFTSCWAENTAVGWAFRRVQYSTLNSTGADYVNYTATDNPYGFGYGSRASGLGVYHFYEDNRVVMNGCGCEKSYGNGIVAFGGGNNQLTINNLHSSLIKSEYVPNYTTYPNYAIGPIQFGLGFNTLTVNGATLDFQNSVVTSSYPTKPVAGFVAFNYEEATYGVRNQKMVVLNSINPVTVPFAGQGNFGRYCLSAWSLYQDPVTTGTAYHDGVVVRALKVMGSGTTIRIPVTSQSSQNRKHTIRISGFDSTANGVDSKAFSVNVGFSSLTSISNITSGNLFGVASVTSNGLNLDIVLPSSINSPFIKIELFCEIYTLIQVDNITVV